jgi:tetratricopeptide (TPR) repeat protein
MAELRYKAYISYSHKDEVWAAWLHRALESYRVPRHLTGSETSHGKVPARIRPVFRDRDDLSSATDLEGTVKKALADSENMILICSPDAAASPWVNEEIRHFSELGRTKRIFCVLVGGQPAADGSVSACFPTALAEIGLHEPLAADVRKWADGKRIAKLKLISGLLDIRLDDLRQRDLQRRRKRQILLGMGIAVALSMAVVTVISQISEQHEREKAEQLATFVVDLGERLKSDVDLETLALISAEASRHLQSLDPEKLSPETGEKVALALRQVGSVSEYQGKPAEALTAYKRSRDLLAGLNEKYPDIPRLLFELGNAEFYIGNLYNQEDQYESAVESMQIYYRLTRKLLKTDPDNPDWILEMAYSHNNLAAIQLDNGKGMDEETLRHISEAVRLMESVVSLKPGDTTVTDAYSNTLAWAADAQTQACNLQVAMAIRNKAVELANLSTRTDPGNNDLKKHNAYALTGIAKMQIVTGNLEMAKINLELAISILQQLSAADPSNVHIHELVVYRKNMLLRLLADSGQLELASLVMEELEIQFESVGESANQNAEGQKEHIEYLLSCADVEYQSGRKESANHFLQKATNLQLEHSGPRSTDIYDTNRLVRARYQWWQLNGEDFFERLEVVPELAKAASSEFRSCTEADTAARIYVIEDDRDKASREIAYLQSKGYADPGFIRFCEGNGLCAR